MQKLLGDADDLSSNTIMQVEANPARQQQLGKEPSNSGWPRLGLACLAAIIVTLSSCQRPNEQALPTFAVVAAMYKQTYGADDTSGFVELDEIWGSLTVDTRARLIKTELSYFPMRIEKSETAPLVLAKTTSGIAVVYNDGSAVLR